MLNWKKLCSMDRESIKKLQNKLLRNFIRHQIPYHPYYRELFKKNKISLSDIKTTDDLVKVPFTTKKDIAPTKKEPKRHLDFVLQPNKKLILKHMPKRKLIWMALKGSVKKQLEYEYKPLNIHFTAGRTAAPTPFLYSAREIDMLREGGRRMMDVFEANPKYNAVNAFPFAPHLAFWQAYNGFNAVGVTSLHTGGGKILGTKGIIRAVTGMKANVLSAMPGYAYHLLKVAAEEKKDFSSIKHLMLGGERVSPELKQRLKELLNKMGAKNPKINVTYAFTEGKVAWPECSSGNCYHLYPDMEFVEIIDPKTGERLEEGQKGEIVYSALDWRGSCVLRYRTADITNGIYYDKCECGRTTPRIGAKIERESEFTEFELTKVKGELVNLNIFFPLLSGHPKVEEWQIELRKKDNDPHEIDEMVIYIAPKKKVDFEKLKKELMHTIFHEINVSPIIVKKGLNELLQEMGMETSLKEKRIIDRRK
jgi:phenylacetate-coenzyme A ligase PaaK-like adenylate-forming protein